MSKVQKSVIDEDEIDTVIEADIRFSGTMESSKSLLIKGKIHGRILCRDDLYFSGESDVDADIQASVVTIRGRLKGSVAASERIQVMAGSQVSASLEAPDIFIEQPECFTGTATLTSQPEEETPIIPDDDDETPIPATAPDNHAEQP
jgi:cytoskeletal protein CcmA (bactofilin family)